MKLLKRFVDLHCMGGKRSVAQYSYLPILLDVLKLRTDSVLEYGTGFSTELINMIKPNARIICVENVWKWYKYYDYKFRNNANITILYEPNLDLYAKKVLYVGEKFNLIFIDGANRISCLHSISYVLADDGCIILHDVDRKDYDDEIKLFKVVERKYNTVLLKSKK